MNIFRKIWDLMVAIVFVILWCATIGRWYAWEEYKKEIIRKARKKGRII